MALLRRKAFATATQEYIEKAKMGGYIGMIYMYDELTHEFLLGWSGLDVDDSSQSLLTALLQKLVTDNRFRDLGEEENQYDIKFSRTNTPLMDVSSQNIVSHPSKRKRLSSDSDPSPHKHNNEPVTSCTSTTYTDCIKTEPDVQQITNMSATTSSSQSTSLQERPPNLSNTDEVDYQRISLDELNDSEMSDLEGCLEPEGSFDGRLLGTDNTMSLSAYSDQTVAREQRRASTARLSEPALRAYLNTLDLSPYAVMGVSLPRGDIAHAQNDDSVTTRRKVVRLYARHMVTRFYNTFNTHLPHHMVKIHYAETIIKYFPALRDKEPTATGHEKLLSFDPLAGHLYVAVCNVCRSITKPMYRAIRSMDRQLKTTGYQTSASNKKPKSSAPAQGDEEHHTMSDPFTKGAAD